MNPSGYLAKITLPASFPDNPNNSLIKDKSTIPQTNQQQL